jgi:hypothetical protein
MAVHMGGTCGVVRTAAGWTGRRHRLALDNEGPADTWSGHVCFRRIWLGGLGRFQSRVNC